MNHHADSDSFQQLITKKQL